ncbi:MAG: SagB/ThcOx family dehydrogenase [Leptospirillum sp.]
MSASNESCAEYYHEDTKYDRKTIHRFQSLDFSSKPAPFKDYQSDNPISLTPFLPFNFIPFTRTPLPEAPPQPPYPWGLSELSQLLFFSYGVTAIIDSPRTEQTFLRAAPSAGGLYPAEVYLATRDLPFIADGIFHYNGKEHTLSTLYEGDFWPRLSAWTFDHPSIEESHAVLILSGYFDRSAWRYGERGYRRILLDTGHLLGNLVLMSYQTGFVPYPLSGFNDQAMNSFLFLGDQKEVVLVAIPLVRLQDAREESLSLPFYPSPVVFPYLPPEHPETGDIFRDLHKFSSLGTQPPVIVNPRMPPSGKDDREESLSRFSRTSEPIQLEPDMQDFESQIPRILLTRRSGRQFSGEPIDFSQLSSILSFSYREIDIPEPSGTLPVQHFFQPGLFSSWLVVNNVTGLASGIYAYDPRGGSLTLMKAGNFQEEIYECVLSQDLGRDAACVLVQTADLESLVVQYGDRVYRTLHMDAGQIGERINLSAVHLGLGASGIGGFYDNEVTDLLGLSHQTAVLYITTIGAIPG